jgi:hypothetical protein
MDELIIQQHLTPNMISSAAGEFTTLSAFRMLGGPCSMKMFKSATATPVACLATSGVA